MDSLTPLKRYQKALDDNLLKPDAAQAQAMKLMDQVYDHMVNPPSTIQNLLGLLFKHRSQACHSLYLWGDVGRGKTYMLDVLFESLPIQRKLRVHFYEFMRDVHDLLAFYKGNSNPLDLVASYYSKRYRIICFDEFFVSDIADAMLLSNLLQAVFEAGVVMVMTSNVEPVHLYRHGLQRARFLPAIAAIEKFCTVYHLDAEKDYRLRMLEKAKVYHTPLDATGSELLDKTFSGLSKGLLVSQQPIFLHGRPVPVVQRSKDVMWITFDALCAGLYSYKDYLEIATLFHTVLLADVRQMGEGLAGDDTARRFLALIDAFYDRQVKVIITAEADIDLLYGDGKLCFEFKRCRSRLYEMQTKHYLSLEHLSD
jgi:cell division protein ZapE